MKVVFCGGHHNSALLVAVSLKEKGHEIYWFGHKYTMIGDKNPGAEYLEVTKSGIPFMEVTAGKWQPKFRFWQNLFRIPLGFIQSLFLLLKIKPNLIVSFGGYLALPVACVGFLLGIPVMTHEQTVTSGLANRFIARFAKKVFVTFESSLKLFPEKKAVLTGLPIRSEIFGNGKKIFANKKRTIYVTGGKQGAHILNKEIFRILPDLTEKFNIIHQCGSTSLYNDIDEAGKLKEKIENKESYLVKEYFFEDEIGSVFKSADFVISRAGGHTVYELLYLKKPAILIPIPWSSGKEQEKNGRMISEIGLAKVLTQSELEEGKLLETILEFDKNLGDYKIKDSGFSVTGSATEEISNEIENFLRNQ